MALKVLVILASLAVTVSASQAQKCSVADLVKRIQVLEPGASGDPKASDDFISDDGVYHRPQPSANEAPTKTEQDDLKAAFTLAAQRSSEFYEALCKLNYIFIDKNSDPDAPIGWGFWEGSYQGPKTGKIQAIGISSALWSGKSFPDLKTIETEIVEELLPKLLNFYYTSAAPDTRQIALLGVLAHEMGHISYRNGDTIAEECFLNHGWKRGLGPVTAKPRHFKQFRDSGQTHRYSHYKTIKNSVDAGKYDNAYEKIDKIYKSGEFAGLFASLSPEEDFAETLKLAVLNQAGLTRLEASVNGDVTDVIIPFVKKKGGLYKRRSASGQIWFHQTCLENRSTLCTTASHATVCAKVKDGRGEVVPSSNSSRSCASIARASSRF